MKARMLIAGQWVSGGEVIEVRSPWDGSTVGSAPIADADMITRAVRSARDAEPLLGETSAKKRSDWLLAIASLIRSRREDFAQLITREAGKPITFSRAEVDRAALTFTCAADEALKPVDHPLPASAYPSGAGYHAISRRIPIGTIVGITPFNFPLNLVAHKLAPAIASGNPILIKPSPRTPLTALLLAEIVLEAARGIVDIDGALSVFPCRNEQIPALLNSPTVAMISFTGSDSVGWKLRQDHPRKRMTLELGGNAASIVHADADLDFAVRSNASGGFGFAGQSCISVQRLYVHDSIYNEFRDRLIAHIGSDILTGDPALDSTVVGPMIDEEALERALARIEKARKSGARILSGGSSSGPCLLPTVIEEPAATLEVVQEEMFAPVVTLHRYRNFDDAIARANDSRFGLQAAVFTKDQRLVNQAFLQLQVGAVVVNQSPTFRLDHLPYGGVKDSGIGREGVASAMFEMTEERVLLRKLN